MKKHLEEVNETYLQHASFALKCAVQLMLLSAALAIHAIYPRWFTRTTSTRLKILLDKMTNRYS